MDTDFHKAPQTQRSYQVEEQERATGMSKEHKQNAWKWMCIDEEYGVENVTDIQW